VGLPSTASIIPGLLFQSQAAHRLVYFWQQGYFAATAVPEAHVALLISREDMDLLLFLWYG
jgi:hypothetical protein